MCNSYLSKSHTWKSKMSETCVNAMFWMWKPSILLLSVNSLMVNSQQSLFSAAVVVILWHLRCGIGLTWLAQSARMNVSLAVPPESKWCTVILAPSPSLPACFASLPLYPSSLLTLLACSSSRPGPGLQSVRLCVCVCVCVCRYMMSLLIA